MKKNKSLSLILPAYRQEKTIIKDVKNLDKVLSSLPRKYEIIVVIDGFVDKTYENISKAGSRRIKILGYKKNKGKGFAIRYGISKAKEDIVGFIDAGMDINPATIPLLLDLME